MNNVVAKDNNYDFKSLMGGCMPIPKKRMAYDRRTSREFQIQFNSHLASRLNSLYLRLLFSGTYGWSIGVGEPIRLTADSALMLSSAMRIFF